ncbi:MAG: hypothetical protein KC616_05390 [Myxococcales bacterium]|nr:hypothetical protein [Myxococcales bacterium]
MQAPVPSCARGRASLPPILIVALSLWAGSAAAQPVYVVDTGPGGSAGGLSLSVGQYLAGRFSLDVGHELVDLEGWMIYPTVVGALPVYAVLYADVGGVPDLDQEIHSQLFTVPAGFTPGWHGVTGLSLPVHGGTYWLAFEVPTGTSGSGAMPPTPLPQLDLYAVDSGAGYVANTTARLGVRILPEPGGLVALAAGVGLLGVGARRRRDAGRRLPFPRSAS